MEPKEVIAMRDKLTGWFKEVGWIGAELEMELADKMILEGWVVAPPGTERPSERLTEQDGEDMLTDSIYGMASPEG